jgi:hypothetical protein
MIRIYACDIVGQGTLADPYRPAIDAYAVKWACAADGRTDDTVAAGTMLVHADASDVQHLALLADLRLEHWDDGDPFLALKAEARFGSAVAGLTSTAAIIAALLARPKQRAAP